MTAEKKEGLSGLVKCLLDNMPALAFTKDAYWCCRPLPYHLAIAP